jgi:hypothetical protein
MTDQLSLLDYQPVPKARRDGPATQKRAAIQATKTGRPQREFDASFVNSIRSMYDAGETIFAIKKKMGLGHATLSRLMEDNGFPERQEKRLPRVDGIVTYVPLTKGYTAVVDTADLHIVGEWQWSASVRCTKAGEVMCVYAQRRVTLPDGKSKLVSLHREILNPGDGLDVDHIDCDGLNNRRSNLRVATRAQNTMNRRLLPTNTSGFRGVCFDKRKNRWTARIKLHGKVHWLGSFKSKEKAAEIYALAAERLHKEFRRLS